ncbi:MAG: hypothetical protein GXP25_24525 [Planctomycetes bacterium]|nr:hypothetical protein [Planctomycetota bacterium]
MSPPPTSDRTKQLKEILDRLAKVSRASGRRLRRIAFRSLLTLFGVAFLIFSGLDLYVKFSTTGRLAISSLSAALLGAAFLLFIVRAVRLHREARRVAVDVESKLDPLETTVSTSIEYGTDPKKTMELSSESIVNRLIQDASERSAKVNYAAAVDRRTPRIVFAALAVVVLLCVGYYFLSPRIFGLTFQRFVKPWADLPAPTLTVVDVTPKTSEVRKLTTVEIKAKIDGRIPSDAAISYAVIPEGQENNPNLKLKWVSEGMQKDNPKSYSFTFARMLDSIKFRVSAGDYTTEDYLLSIYEVPKITQLKMKLTYPLYTKLKSRQIDDAIGPVTALKGTEVDITGLVNKKIAEAQVEFQNPKRPMEPAYKVDGKELHVMFTVNENDKYRLTVIDDRGRTNEESIFYTIKAIEDKFPTVKVVKPGKNITAVKTTEVPMVIQASDDFGVREVGIAYKIKTDEEKRVTVREIVEPSTNVRAEHTFYLEDLELADTDVVSYYAYAIDNDTVSGPKESVSDLFFIEIEPYGQQYRYADQEGQEGKKGEKEKGFINNLANLIKAQQKALRETFNLNRLPREKWQPEHETQAKNLSSEEKSLQTHATQLAEELMEKLKKAGLEEHMDRAENISKASDQLGLASMVLDQLLTDSALPYENQGLYHLYRAKRDILHLIQMAKESGDKELEEKIRQALEMANKDQKTREQKERERQIAELQKKKQEAERLAEQQKDINRKATEQAAKEVKQGKISKQQKREMEQLAQEQAQAEQKAKEMTQDLYNMHRDNPKQSYSAARDVNQAANEMAETKKALENQKPADARDHGTKAEKALKNALKNINRALEKSVTDQLKSAAEQARELAEREKEVAQQAQQLASAKRQPQKGQPQQQGQRKQQPQGKQQQGQQQQGQQQKGQQQKGQQQQGQQKSGEQQKGDQQGKQQAGQQKPGEQKGQQQAGKQQGQQEGDQAQAQAKGQKPGDQKAQQGQKAQGQDMAAKDGQQQQKGDQQAQQKSKQQDGQQQGKNAPGPGPKGPFDKYPGKEGQGRSPAAQQQELAQEQERVREDLDDLGKRLGNMVPKIEKVDPDVGENVAKVAEQIDKGDTQRQMARAADKLKRSDPRTAQRDAQGAEKKLDKMANDLADLAEQFAMDDARRLGKAIEKARELADRQEKANDQMGKLADAKKKPADRKAAAKKPDAEKVRKEQGDIKKETEKLAKQAERIKSLEKSGLNKSVQRSLDTAKEQMEKAETLIPFDPKTAQEGGKEAEAELRQTAKAMRRMLNETLNEQLAKTVQKAKETEKFQKDSKETLEKASKGKRDGKPIDPRKADQAQRDQREAQKSLDDLQDRMKKLAAQARAAAEQEIADAVKKAEQELNEAKTDQQMAQAQKNMKGKRWSRAKSNQAEASRAVAAAKQRVEDLYEDRTSLPLQRMKAAVEETKDLRDKVDEMKSKVQKQQADAKKGPPGRKGRGEAQEKMKQLAEEQKDLDKKASALMDRLQRIDPNVEKELAEKVKLKMRDVTAKVAKGHLKDAEPGLSETAQSLQKIGEGLIQRLARLIDKSRRRDPTEENAPLEYKAMVEKYFRALSEK